MSENGKPAAGFNSPATLRDDDIVTTPSVSRRLFIRNIGPLGLAAAAAVLGSTAVHAADGTDNNRAVLADPKLPRAVNNDENDWAWNDDNTWIPSDLQDGDRFN